MDFEEIARTCEVPIGSLKIKNKGSIVKLGAYYQNMYTLLIEKYDLKCQETGYVHWEKPDGIEAREFKWVAYRKLDNFARLRFNLGNNAYFVKADKVAGIFGVSYTLELDYNKMWRNSSILSFFLRRYLQWFYAKTILSYIVRYQEELQSIKELVKKELNASVYD